MSIIRYPLALVAMGLAFPLTGLQAATAEEIAGTRLDVSTSASVSRAPDVVTISAGVVNNGATASLAMSENAKRMTATMAELKKAGIADKDIQTAALSLSPQYRYQENQPPVITGYEARNQVSVRFRDIKNSGAILDALVKAGANSIDGPNFSVDNADALRDSARTEALKKARQRAQVYASAAGLQIKRIISISENATPDYPRPQMAMMAKASRDEASTPVAAGEQELTVNISVVFELN